MPAAIGNRKVCPTCRVEKDVTEFRKRPSRSDGLCAQCRACETAYRKSDRARALGRAKTARWAATHPDKVRESRRKYLEANREKVRQTRRKYLVANRERIHECWRAYYEANRDRMLERARTYREANRDPINERQSASKIASMRHLRDEAEALADLLDSLPYVQREELTFLLLESDRGRASCFVSQRVADAVAFFTDPDVRADVMAECVEDWT